MPENANNTNCMQNGPDRFAMHFLQTAAKLTVCAPPYYSKHIRVSLLLIYFSLIDSRPLALTPVDTILCKQGQRKCFGDKRCYS